MQWNCLFGSSERMSIHWGRVKHICVSKLNSIGSDNGLSPGRRQAIIWTNAGILLIGTLGINFSEILIEIDTFSFKKMHLNMSNEEKWRSFCLGLNVLMYLCMFVWFWVLILFYILAGISWHCWIHCRLRFDSYSTSLKVNWTWKMSR